MRQYPFPVPFGWFQIGFPADVAAGKTKPLYYFGRHLVLWRDDAGAPHLHDAFCPHLGAHLGHGGTVRDGAITCPFHGWSFDAGGHNCEIPYSSRVNRQAHIRTYPIVERNGLLMAWYHPHDEPPLWDVPVVPELSDPDWTDMVSRDWVIRAHWQEIAENVVDSAHFHFVHHTEIVPEIVDVAIDGSVLRMQSVQKFPTPQGIVDGNIDADTYGPGFGLVRFKGIVETVNLGCSTPIDAATSHLRFNFTVRKLGNEDADANVIEAFVNEVSNQVIEDIPIWENKAFNTRPALADNDGPFVKFRRWASQFYAEDVEAGRTVWTPGMDDPTKPIEVVQLGQTAAARIHGGAAQG